MQEAFSHTALVWRSRLEDVLVLGNEICLLQRHPDPSGIIKPKKREDVNYSRDCERQNTDHSLSDSCCWAARLTDGRGMEKIWLRNVSAST